MSTAQTEGPLDDPRGYKWRDHNGDRVWRKHFNGTWCEQAMDPERSVWNRIEYLANCRAATNGHAVFRTGELGLLLAMAGKDPHDQADPLDPIDPSYVGKQIRRLIAKGLLEQGSFVQCLHVSKYVADGGSVRHRGSENAVCQHQSTHDRLRNKTKTTAKTEEASG